MDFMQSIGSGLMNRYDQNTKEGQAGLFGTSVLNNLANQIGGSGVNQMNAIRSAYKLDNIDAQGMPNLFSQGARVSEAGNIQRDADAQKKYWEALYGKSTPEVDGLRDSLQEMIRAMKAGNLTFRR